MALDHTLANDYAARAGVGVRDHVIINQSLRDMTGINPHDATGYLANLDVRKVVYHAMRFDTAGRFVVARDVAERFAARAVRHPVLIEVLEPRYRAVDEKPADVKKREQSQSANMRTLEGRVGYLAAEVLKVVKDHHPEQNAKDLAKAANVQKLRKYVAAHLTPTEIQELGTRPRELHVYAVWRLARKQAAVSLARATERRRGPAKLRGRRARRSLGRARHRLPFGPSPLQSQGPRWQKPRPHGRGCAGLHDR